MAETYAACVEQPIHRLTWAILASMNYVGVGFDVSNAFAEAPPPDEQYYMKVDAQFRDWWESQGRPPIPEGYVIPVMKNLQGHPLGPRLWGKHINKILVEDLGYEHTTHEPCLYYKR